LGCFVDSNQLPLTGASIVCSFFNCGLWLTASVQGFTEEFGAILQASIDFNGKRGTEFIIFVHLLELYYMLSNDCL
jgi:hypothetical protein